MMEENVPHQLIDVREDHEVEVCNLGGVHIPMAEVVDNLDKIAKDKRVVVHCKMGGRSAAICNLLENSGFDNAYNLQGGIFAWIDEIDNSLSKY
mgnify:FL=1